MNAVLVFLRAALPWITVGLLYAVLFAIRGKRKKLEAQPAGYGAEGMGCGIRPAETDHARPGKARSFVWKAGVRPRRSPEKCSFAERAVQIGPEALQ